jgi:Divergent InlB B-repeat domain
VISGDRLKCGGAFTACDRLANPDTVITLTATPAPGASFLQWSGACAAAGESPTCQVTALGARTVSAVFLYPVVVRTPGTGGGTVSSDPDVLQCPGACTVLYQAGTVVTLTAAADSASTFAGWGGDCAGSDPACLVTVAGPIHAEATFDSVVSAEEDGDGTAYAWARVADARAAGGAYRWERRASATAEHAFTGSAVTLVTVSGPTMGRARVSVDGTVLGTFDGYAPSLRFGVERRYTGLGSGDHVLTVETLGTKRPASSGTRVAIDALRWGGTLHVEPAAVATWGRVSDAGASGGAFAISDAAGAFARLRFHGTGATLVTRRGPSMGRAEVWVDGSLWSVVDLYRPTNGFASLTLVRSLADRWHVVKLVVRGTKRAASAGTSVAVDRWVVR